MKRAAHTTSSLNCSPERRPLLPGPIFSWPLHSASTAHGPTSSHGYLPIVPHKTPYPAPFLYLPRRQGRKPRIPRSSLPVFLVWLIQADQAHALSMQHEMNSKHMITGSLKSQRKHHDWTETDRSPVSAKQAHTPGHTP